MIVNDNPPRKIVYDIVTLDIPPPQKTQEQEQDPPEGEDETSTIPTNTTMGTTGRLDDTKEQANLNILLLHGMAPNGRKCWGYIKGSRTKNGNTVEENLEELTDSIQQHQQRSHSTRTIIKIRLILPDRPGYCDSDPILISNKNPNEDSDTSKVVHYSYKQFASDMETLIQHVVMKDGKSNRQEQEKEHSQQQSQQQYWIVLGTSSGGPCALSVTHYLFLNPQSKDIQKQHHFLGTILCSSDGPYKHPSCPANIWEQDSKYFNDMTIYEYTLKESKKKFRKHIQNGFMVDFLLERQDNGWGYDYNVFLPATTTSTNSSDNIQDNKTNTALFPVHLYLGGEKDDLTIRMVAPFLQQWISGENNKNVPLYVLSSEDHFYASRRPHILGTMICEIVFSP